MNDKTNTEYDIIIVGSGAAGGISAYTLAHAGMKVLMLEAGRDYDPIRETPMWQLPKDAPLRAAPTPDKPRGFYDATVGGGYDVPGEPYTTAPGTTFKWWRPRMLGGRTNHWGRVSLRFGPYDFMPKSRDGLGFDWPISYEDIAPYYDKVEALIGVFGAAEGIENSPNSPPGILQPPPKPRAYELLIKKHCTQLGIPVVPTHMAVLTKPLNGRSACVYATPCKRGCSLGAFFQTPTVLLPPALATGKLNIRTDAMVREITINSKGLATGVKFIDKKTNLENHARARVVILAASTGESIRILLNSKSHLFPQGLGNSSGLLGKYLMETVSSIIFSQIPALENMPPHNEEGVVGSGHVYMPWWGYKMQAQGQLDFPRGYHIAPGGGRQMPTVNTFINLDKFTTGSYGKQLKQDARRYYGSFVTFMALGEMIPNENCYCDIDPQKKDKWGIPVLRFHWQWGEHEIRQAIHMQHSIVEIIESMGGRIRGTLKSGEKGMYRPGSVNHEVGGASMGKDPNDSVLTQYGQTWDVKNVFVNDGASFVSNPHKNPTLSIMALAWRNCDYIIKQLKGGTL